jgi:hypothetical protein
MLPGRTPEQYYQDNKQEIKLNERHRQYRQENKEYINERQRQYNRDNKEELKRKHNCQCGGKYTKANKSIHEKTQKHQTFISNHQPINNYGVIDIYNAPNQ